MDFDGGDFSEAIFSSKPEARFPSKFKFTDAVFSGGTVWFDKAVFSGGDIYFDGAKFSSGQVRFDGAKFSGAQVSFERAVFCGGQVDFSNVADWSHPPEFDWETPPAGVTLPADVQTRQARTPGC